MDRDCNDYLLKDIPKEFLKNHNNLAYKDTNDVYIASKNEILGNQHKTQNSFDNVWLLLILVIIFDLL